MIKTLPDIRTEQRLNIIVYLNEQNCNFCNNHVTMHLKQISYFFPQNIIIIINGSEKFFTSVKNHFEKSKIIRNENLNAMNYLTHPICLFVDNNNNLLLTLKADLEKIDEISDFFLEGRSTEPQCDHLCVSSLFFKIKCPESFGHFKN